MDSGKFEGADFKADVCQLVSVEHFSRKTHFHDGRQKLQNFQLFHFPPCTKNYLQV